MSTCPYNGRPKYTKWRHAMAGIPANDVYPMVAPRFPIRSGARVATAGSCFAQHIAGYLQKAGIEPFVAEPAPPQLDSQTARHFQYGIYSARYGNIYTPRQLLQLLRRAQGVLNPAEAFWEANDRYVDPYRPSVQGEGFYSVGELKLDGTQHLAYVREMFERLDVFIFTLGLTEAWFNKADGMVFPVCPGCGWGTFGESYGFVNFSLEEIEADLLAFADELRLVNPIARIILTVSPVSLVATGEDKHILTATTYSKSVLRVAAERVRMQREFVEYFPSYEIITGPHSRGRYFADDLRSVTPEGVEHVMKVFVSSFLENQAGPENAASTGSESAEVKIAPERTLARLAEVICEEEVLDQR